MRGEKLLGCHPRASSALPRNEKAAANERRLPGSNSGMQGTHQSIIRAEPDKIATVHRSDRSVEVAGHCGACRTHLAVRLIAIAWDLGGVLMRQRSGVSS